MRTLWTRNELLNDKKKNTLHNISLYIFQHWIHSPVENTYTIDLPKMIVADVFIQMSHRSVFLSLILAHTRFCFCLFVVCLLCYFFFFGIPQMKQLTWSAKGQFWKTATTVKRSKRKIFLLSVCLAHLPILHFSLILQSNLSPPSLTLRC